MKKFIIFLFLLMMGIGAYAQNGLKVYANKTWGFNKGADGKWTKLDTVSIYDSMTFSKDVFSFRGRKYTIAYVHAEQTDSIHIVLHCKVSNGTECDIYLISEESGNLFIIATETRVRIYQFSKKPEDDYKGI